MRPASWPGGRTAARVAFGVCLMLFLVGRTLALSQLVEDDMFNWGLEFEDYLDESLQVELGSFKEASRSQLDSHDCKSWQPLRELKAAVHTLQDCFFELWLGVYPDSIDWTGAVVNTHLSAAMSSISSSYHYNHARYRTGQFDTYTEELINRYFSQSTAYYFGENIFGIRGQAHDDMLWVVLGWLEAIRFAVEHDTLHHSPYRWSGNEDKLAQWFGRQWEPAFAHRARVFYDIVAAAWDEGSCGGGLTWNPRLQTYKNTVTNTQYIAASVGMYLYHPGDNNSAPWSSRDERRSAPDNGSPPAKAHDRKYLDAAVKAYDWLQSVQLKNKKGLYADGFHISPGNRNKTSVPAQCDERDEMVYTYNQGVLLSGLRQLWDATGDRRYLADGHTLVRAVLRETGWPIADTKGSKRRPRIPDMNTVLRQPLSTTLQAVAAADAPPGLLGAHGILTEHCDPAGACSQDAHAFKGILLHHLTAFCAPLPTSAPRSPAHAAPRALAFVHHRACAAYGPWVALNARAALGTRDARGVMGAWWAVGLPGRFGAEGSAGERELPPGAQDVRNNRSVLAEPQWQRPGVPVPPVPEPRGGRDRAAARAAGRDGGDLNDRGRGRTVETHASGLAVVRACWQFAKWANEGVEDSFLSVY